MTRLIDADALSSCKFVIEDVSYAYARGWYENGWNDCNSYWMKIINEAPTVTPDMAQVLAYECGKSSDRLKGKWLFKEITDDYKVYGQCSICKQRKRVDNFCSNCGAEMEANNDKAN